MKSFFETTTGVPIGSPAPWSFCRDPETGQSVLTEECITGLQVRKNWNVGFDDSEVYFLTWSDVRELAENDPHMTNRFDNKYRLRMCATFQILRNQVTR